MLLFFLFIPVIIFGLFALYFAVVYNKLVALKNAAAAAWHQIDVQLTRRADLVGNLVETVRGYAGHEKGVLENVTAARASVPAAAASMRPARPPASSIPLSLGYSR